MKKALFPIVFTLGIILIIYLILKAKKPAPAIVQAIHEPMGPTLGPKAPLTPGQVLPDNPWSVPNQI